MPFALLSIQIKQAVFVGQRQLQPRSPVGASSWVRPPPGSPTAWSPAQDVERWIPTPVCVCVCVCVVSRLRLCYIRLLQWSTLFIPVPLSWPSSRWPVAAPGQGHGQGVGALEVSEVRDPPPCLLTAQSAFTFFPLVKQTRTDGVHSHFHGGV